MISLQPLCSVYCMYDKRNAVRLGETQPCFENTITNIQKILILLYIRKYFEFVFAFFALEHGFEYIGQ